MATVAAMAIFVTSAGYSAPSTARETRTSSVLIVVDGLRPDYVTPAIMPNLHKLGKSGVRGERHTAVFPSSTRANATSISTGVYPWKHGILNNTMWLPQLGDEELDLGGLEALERLDAISGGRMLTAPSAGEMFDKAGLRFFVTGSSGAGTARLQNPRGSGMGIWNRGVYFVPEEAREEALAAIGKPRSGAAGRTAWAFDAFLYKALGEDRPDFTLMWIGEVDGVEHREGVGAPATLKAVQHVDHQIGRMVDALKKGGILDQVNIFVTGDHGFTTSGGDFTFSSIPRIIGNGLMRRAQVKRVQNLLYVQASDPELLRQLVEPLQRHPAVGNIYTRPVKRGAEEGIVPGTLSTEMIFWNHERSADIVVAPAWTDEVNEFGYPGTTTRRGKATHGSDSLYDLRIPLIAAGPSIKKQVVSDVPSGQVDLVPTILHLSGVEPPASLDGRVLQEILLGGPNPGDVEVKEQVVRASVTYSDGFVYKAELDVLQVESTRYLNGSRTTRGKSRIK